MKRLSEFLDRITTGWTFLASTLLFALFLVFVLPWVSSYTASFTSEAGAVDAKFFYTEEELYNTAGSYGEEGRRVYAIARVSFDLIFPLVYTFFLVASISFTSRFFFTHTHRLRLLNLIPLLAMLFDLLENTGIVAVMLIYPNRLLWMGWLTAFFTLFKWIFVSLAMALALVAVIAWAFSRLAGREVRCIM